MNKSYVISHLYIRHGAKDSGRRQAAAQSSQRGILRRDTPANELPEDLVEMQVPILRSELGPRSCISNKVPGVTDIAGL